MTIGIYDQTEYKNKHGNLHRKDVPAVKWEDGSEDWYLHDKQLDFEFTSLQDLYDNHSEFLI